MLRRSCGSLLQIVGPHTQTNAVSSKQKAGYQDWANSDLPLDKTALAKKSFPVQEVYHVVMPSRVLTFVISAPTSLNISVRSTMFHDNKEQYKPIVWLVSRHFGPRTLRTQDILAPSDWCRNVRTVPHQCRSVSRTLRHWYRTVSTSSKHFCYNRLYRSKVIIIIKEDHWFTQEYTAED